MTRVGKPDQRDKKVRGFCYCIFRFVVLTREEGGSISGFDLRKWKALRELNLEIRSSSERSNLPLAFWHLHPFANLTITLKGFCEQETWIESLKESKLFLHVCLFYTTYLYELFSCHMHPHKNIPNCKILNCFTQVYYTSILLRYSETKIRAPFFLNLTGVTVLHLGSTIQLCKYFWKMV